MTKTDCDLLIVGNAGGTHVGWSLSNASVELGIRARFLDARRAFEAPLWMRQTAWRLLGHKPAHLARFSAELVRLCEELRPRRLLATGLAPVNRRALESIGRLGVERLNYLTDDPWNPAFRARWFFKALPMYDTVFSPRRANTADLESLGCRTVRYLPFGFDPKWCYPQMAGAAEMSRLAADILFVGGADRGRGSLHRRAGGRGFLDCALRRSLGQISRDETV